MATPLLELKSKHTRALEILHVRAAPAGAGCMKASCEATAPAHGGQTKLQENVALRAEVESLRQASKEEHAADLARLRAELGAKHESELEAVRAPSSRVTPRFWTRRSHCRVCSSERRCGHRARRFRSCSRRLVLAAVRAASSPLPDCPGAAGGGAKEMRCSCGGGAHRNAAPRGRGEWWGEPHPRSRRPSSPPRRRRWPRS